MKRLIIFLLLFAAIKVAGQTTGYLRFDTVLIYKVGGTAELALMNATKDTLGVLVNYGNGRTRFMKSRAINDSTIVVGLDTLTIRGIGGSGSGDVDSIHIYTASAPDPDTLYQYIGGDSTLVGLIPKGGASTDTTRLSFPLYAKTGDEDTLNIYRDSAYMVPHLVQDTLGTNLSPRATAGSMVEYPDGHLLSGYSFYFGANIGDQDSAKIAFRRSYDRGRSWTDPVFVSPPSGYKLMYVPSLKLIGDTLYMVCPAVTAALNTDFFVFKSVDTGKTWNAGTMIPGLPTDRLKTHGSHRLFERNGRIFYPVAFNRPGSGTSTGTGEYDGHLLYSDDNMNTWTLHSLQIMTDDSIATELEIHAAANDSLYITWRGRTGWMLYVASGDNGDNWVIPTAINPSTANFGIQKPNSMHSIQQIHNDRLWVAIINPVVDGFINNSADGRRRVQILASTSGKPGTFYPAQLVKYDTTGGRSYGDINIFVTTDYAYAAYYVGNRENTGFQYELTRMPLNKFSYAGITDSLPGLLVKAKNQYHDTVIASFTEDKTMPAGVNDIGSIDIVTMPRNGVQDFSKFIPGIKLRGFGSNIATGGVIQGVVPTNAAVTPNSNWDAALNFDFTFLGGELTNHDGVRFTNNGNAPFLRMIPTASTDGANVWFKETALFGSTTVGSTSYLWQARNDVTHTSVGIENRNNDASQNRMDFLKLRGSSQPSTNDFIGGFTFNNSNNYFRAVGSSLTNSVTSARLVNYTLGAVNQANSNIEIVRWTSEGKMGLGTNAPSALLHLAAGGTAANSAALKLSLGNDLTTAETGALEYAASGGINRLAFTPVSTTRMRIPLMNDVTPAAGGILQGDGSNFALLSLGTAGQSLRVNAGGTALEYYTPAGTTYTFQHSLTESAGTVNLVGDQATPGNTMLYGTDGSGNKGWYAQPAGGGSVTDFIFTDANGFDGTVSTSTSTPTLALTTSLTTGSVPFIGASGALSQDNANLFWNNTDKRLGIGTATPGYKFDLRGTTGGNLHIVNDADDDGFYISAGAGLTYFQMNSLYNGSTHTAKATTSAVSAMSGSTHFWYANSGLTAGNTYSLTERMRLNTTGLGIGTTGPDRLLDVLHATVPQQRWTNVDGTTYGELFVNSSGNYIWSGSNTSPLMALGGSTSSFPSLLRDGAAIQVRLADNSANANLKVLDQAYDATTWNGNDEVPTKNAIRDKIETLSGGISGLTAGRVTLSTGSTTIGDDANLLYSSSNAGTFSLGTTATRGHFNLGGNRNFDGTGSSTGWGIGQYSSATTYTDNVTSASGSTNFIQHYFETPTLAASNASVTATSPTTLRVDAPVAGTNVSITGIPYAITAFGGAVWFNGAVKYVVSSPAHNSTVGASDHIIKCDATSANYNVNLPDASTYSGVAFTFKRIDASGNTCTVTRAGSDTIDGATSYSLTAQYKYVTVVSDGTTWMVVANN